MESKPTEEGLQRVIGVRGLTANVVNNMIGAGIFALPAIVAIQLGAAGFLAYLFCAAVLITIILCYLEVTSRITKSGGSYAYVEAAFGPYAGFLTNTLFLLGWGIGGDAAVLNIIADSLSVLFPVFKNPGVRDLFFFILLTVLVFINIRGVKQGVRFIIIITIIKLIPLLLLVIFGFGYISSANLQWSGLPTLKNLGEASLVLFFAFGGFETALSMSGEIKNPKRTIPSGIFLAVIIVTVFYLFLQAIVLGVLGSSVSQFKDAPLAAVADQMIGAVGSTILLIAAMVSSAANTSGDLLSTPRLLFAGARDGLFPKYLAKIHPRFATPYSAIITYTLLVFLVAISGSFAQLAILSSGTLLLTYLGVVLAVIRLRFKKEINAEKTFKFSPGIFIPILAVIAIVWLLSHLSNQEMISILIFFGIATCVYIGMKFTKKRENL